MRIGWTEIILILVLAMVLFGTAKLPGMAKNIADSINVFKKELKTKDKKQAPGDKPEAEPKPAPSKKPAPKKSAAPSQKTVQKKPAKKNVKKK